MDIYYNETLNAYVLITYDALHGFIIDGLREWYEKWPPNPKLMVQRKMPSRYRTQQVRLRLQLVTVRQERRQGPREGPRKGPRHTSRLQRERTLPRRRP